MDISEENQEKSILTDETGHYEPIMTVKEMRERIIDLEEENFIKNARIEMLEQCLLEMSEVVYAGD